MDTPRPVIDLGRGRVKLWLRPEIEEWSTQRLVNDLGEHGLGDYRDALSSDDPPAAGSRRF